MYLLPINGIIGEDFKLSDALMHLNAAKNEPVIKLIINSVGGYTDEADKIEEALRNEKKIYYSTNSGDVASAAVELFCVAPKENRTFDISKGQFLIHMPFLMPEDGGATGTAEEIERIVEEMKNLEKETARKYQKATGTSANILTGFMKENVPLTEEQIQSLGFATIIKPTFKAVAYFKNDNMTNEEVTKKLGTLEGLINKVVGFLRPKAIMLQDVNGQELDFGNDIQDVTQISVGVAATVAGQPADGEYVMPDGTTYVFSAGVLNEIRPPESTELTELKQQNQELQERLTAKEQEFETFKTQAESQITNIKNEFLQFRSQFSDGNPGGKGASFEDNENERKTVRKPFKTKNN
jgi:ATP-dependent protease ClpP protease subunit